MFSFPNVYVNFVNLTIMKTNLFWTLAFTDKHNNHKHTTHAVPHKLKISIIIIILLSVDIIGSIIISTDNNNKIHTVYFFTLKSHPRLNDTANTFTRQKRIKKKQSQGLLSYSLDWKSGSYARKWVPVSNFF